MFARYLKAQALVLLFGGIVGPIFMIVYFAIGPWARPYIAWMFYVGLLITAADVLIALWLANFNAKSAAATAVLEQNGVLALARITGIAETNMRINDRPMMAINLHVEGPGIMPFDAQDRIVAHVTRQMNLSKGKLVVLVDPTTNKFQIDWERSGLVNGLVPAQFTISEDNRTYDLTGQAEPLMEVLQLLKNNGIALNNMVDLRSNPAVRQQLLAIVRRAAPQASQPAAAPAATPVGAAPAMAPTPGFAAPTPSISQRLQELETLRATGAVSDDEYKAKRAQIIADI